MLEHHLQLRMQPSATAEERGSYSHLGTIFHPETCCLCCWKRRILGKSKRAALRNVPVQRNSLLPPARSAPWPGCLQVWEEVQCGKTPAISVSACLVQR